MYYFQTSLSHFSLILPDFEFYVIKVKFKHSLFWCAVIVTTPYSSKTVSHYGFQIVLWSEFLWVIMSITLILVPYAINWLPSFPPTYLSFFFSWWYSFSVIFLQSLVISNLTYHLRFKDHTLCTPFSKLTLSIQFSHSVQSCPTPWDPNIIYYWLSTLFQFHWGLLSVDLSIILCHFLAPIPRQYFHLSSHFPTKICDHSIMLLFSSFIFSFQ